MTPDSPASSRLSTGIPGLDEVVDGGFIPGRSYMVRGRPGVGKTLLGLHFLTADPDDDALFINLGETEADITDDAASFGIDVSEVAFLDLTPSGEFFAEEQGYDVFPSSSVEGPSITDRITTEIEELAPDRVFVDPLTQFTFLSGDEYQYRRSILSFLQYLRDNDSTVVFTSQDTRATPDDDLQFMSDGIVHLSYDSDRRNLEVSKFRSSDFAGGVHAVDIDDDGMHVFPKLRPREHGAAFSPETISSGVAELDALLNGGLERGTVTILSGPSGVGKTTTGTQFLTAAAQRGEQAVVYLFEESKETFVHRLRAIDVHIDEMIEAGSLVVREIAALDTTVEEFDQTVREDVEDLGVDIVMIDGVDGYEHSLAHGDHDYLVGLHALGRYLKNVGVTTILVSEVSHVTGDFRATKHQISYFADTLVFLRYLEFQGRLQKAIGVLKKRASDFERTLREFEITDQGIVVGEPMSNLRGILRGTPDLVETDAEE